MSEESKWLKMDQAQDPNCVDTDAPGEHATPQLSQGLLSASYQTAGQGFSMAQQLAAQGEAERLRVQLELLQQMNVQKDLQLLQQRQQWQAQ